MIPFSNVFHQFSIISCLFSLSRCVYVSARLATALPVLPTKRWTSLLPSMTRESDAPMGVKVKRATPSISKGLGSCLASLCLLKIGERDVLHQFQFVLRKQLRLLGRVTHFRLAGQLTCMHETNAFQIFRISQLSLTRGRCLWRF